MPLDVRDEPQSAYASASHRTPPKPTATNVIPAAVKARICIDFNAFAEPR
jgi:hypothetical protein